MNNLNSQIANELTIGLQSCFQELNEIRNNNPEFELLLQTYEKLDILEVQQKMLEEFKENYYDVWINPKYNKELDLEFNLIDFMYGGLANGTEIDAYAFNLNSKYEGIPDSSFIKKNVTQLNNIETFPTCELIPMSIIFTHFQTNFDFWNEDDNYDILLSFYSLSVTMSYLCLHEVLKKLHSEDFFNKLNLGKPFHFTISEHDGGDSYSVCYIIKD